MGEEKKDASQLREVHHLLTQGKSDEAQTVLAQISGETPALRHELDYVHAWNAAVQEQWELVAQQVQNFPVLLHVKERADLLTNGSARRRRPMCLLMLGEMARKLGYPEEAIDHIQHGLALLNERRMNIPEVRLLAYCNLGRLALEMNQTAQALIQYEAARNLCSDEGSEHPLLPTILMGLCETYIRLEQFEQALAIGKQALHLLEQGNAIGCQEQLLLMLSRASLSLHDSASALVYAQDAQRRAQTTGDPVHLSNALLVLARVQYRERQTQEARANCQEILTLLQEMQDHPLRGSALFLLGKITEAEWRLQPEQTVLANEAQTWYEQACAFFTARHNLTSLARVARRLAQLLEDRGQPALALEHWKKAYTLTGERG